MIRRTLTALLLALVAGTGMLWAAAQSNNALAVDENGGTVTYTTSKKAFLGCNDGANVVSVKMYAGSDTIAIHTHAATGSFSIAAGACVSISWDSQQDGGIGFTGFSHRSAAGQTTTLRWYAK